MGYIRLDEQPGEVYHYTHRKNLDSILRDGRRMLSRFFRCV